MRPYDALLVVSFGGPEGPDDVMPFLETVTAGRGVPRERLAEVAEHYYHFGGVSPINGQNRALITALQADFAEAGLDLPIYWGNRNWHPLLPDTLRQMRDDGVTNAIAFLTSAYASFSGCRQYLDAIELARVEVGDDAPHVDRLRQYFNHPGFIDPMVDGVRRALSALPALPDVPALPALPALPDVPALPDLPSSPDSLAAQTHLAFVAHSVPTAMEVASGPGGHAYTAQLEEACRLVAAAVGASHPVSLSYCSRSGSPSVPWLEPDIGDRLRELKDAGTQAVVAVPIGFVSDHMEVVYDLDTEAAARADELGLAFVRSPTVGVDPRFVTMVRELVVERMGESEPRALGELGPAHDVCPVGCCRMSQR